MAKGHALSGVCAGLLAAPVAVQLAPGVVDPVRALMLSGAFSALVALGALWPDIDHKPAFISKCLWVISRVVCWVMRQVSMAVYEATRTDQDREGGCHRTFTHTLPFVFLTGLAGAAAMLATPARPWALFVGVALALGTLTHILGDAMTLSGVPIYWPLLDHRGRRWGTRGLRWFKAGGKVGERLATLFFTGLAMGLGALTTIAAGLPWWSPILTAIGG